LIFHPGYVIILRIQTSCRAPEVVVKLHRYVIIPLFILAMIAAGSLGCDKEDDGTDTLMMAGLGCAATQPVTMRSTTYNMSDQVIGISEQVMQNMAVSSSQPAMHEMYAGVEITIDLNEVLDHILDILSNPDNIMYYLVSQNPLLTQFWALKKMATSTNKGGDGTWMTGDDTIDLLLGYFETTKVDDRYRLISYSDFGVTPSGRTDFVVERNRKVKTYEYSAGSDGDFGTDDDQVTRVTLFEYNGDGKMVRAKHYAADETTFQSSYVFTYDESDRLVSMMSYGNEGETTRIDWGSYSNLTWNDAGGVVTLDIALGLRIWLIGDMPLMNFHIEFNEDGTMHKMITYEALSSSSIDACSVYRYSGEGLLGAAGMSDRSDNYSDDEATQVSYTLSELIFGEE
jgi:hypothetical protein